MARFENPQLTAAERLRVLVSRERGGYQKGRKKWARILGVSERSVERYLQRTGANKRNIRSREAQAKINRAFRGRMRKDPLFLATHILKPGQQFDVTPYMVPVIGDNENPIMPIWQAGSEFRNPSSVWDKRKTLPRIYITGGERMGLGFTRFAINTATLTGEPFLEGEKTEIAMPNEMASNTFGFVDDPELEIRGRPNDLSNSLNELIGYRLSGVKLDENGRPMNIDASTVIIYACFTPKGLEIAPMPPIPFTPETSIKNRKPNVKYVRNEETGEMEFDSMYWTTTKRRRK